MGKKKQKWKENSSTDNNYIVYTVLLMFRELKQIQTEIKQDMPKKNGADKSKICHLCYVLWSALIRLYQVTKTLSRYRD